MLTASACGHDQLLGALGRTQGRDPRVLSSGGIDGEGRLVGLLFDGNYESIAADWVYQAAVNRSICVDVRWVGFTLQQMDGAGWILDELGLPAK